MFSHEMMAGRLASTTFMVCHSTSFPFTCHPASPQDLSSSIQQMSRPFSTFTVPNPLSRNVGSPFPSWSLTHHGHICLPRDTTLAKLWCLCGAGTVHLRSQLQFLTKKVQNMRRLGVCKEPREGEQGLQPRSPWYPCTTTQTAPLLGATGWYFGEILVPRESYKLPTINRQLLDKCSNIQLTQFSHI